MWVFAIFFAALCGAGLWALNNHLRDQRRIRLRGQPFPEEWTAILERDFPLYTILPEVLRQQLHGHIQVFLHEKRFEGCGGLTMTDEIRVLIAAQACVLLLNQPTNYYSRLVSIVVYPSTFVATRINSDLSREKEVAMLGESWQHGTVVLAWDAVRQGAAGIADGQNVVFHEFAHQLDQEDGVSNGAPILSHPSHYATWARILGQEYERLRNQEDFGVLDSYGASNPAEFFAVVTEAFFEKPIQLQQRHPELYAEMQKFYRVDPTEWHQADKQDQPQRHGGTERSLSHEASVSL